MDQALILKNKGQRTLAKLKLNSMWGKWAQNQNKTQTNLVTSVKELYELLTSPGTEVKNIFPNDGVVWVSWKQSEENITAGKNVNVAVDAYVTTPARLKRYEYLSELEKPVLYFDTESVIFIQNVDEPPKLRSGDYLGPLTDESEEIDCSLYSRICVGWTKELSVFCFLPLDRKTSYQMQGKWYNLE